MLFSFTSPWKSLALTLLSTLLLIESAMAAQYIFTVFTSASESNMNVYHSTDATNFDLVKENAYTPLDGLLRDPSPIYHKNTFFIAYTTGWEGRNFALAKSTNLVDWTLHTTVQVPYPLVTRTWAPEFFKDPRTGKTHIIVSLGETLNDFEAYLYTATDDTFLNWGTPQPMVGIGPNYIDTFVVYKPSTDGKAAYHAFSKNESAKYIEHATAQSVAGPWTFVQTGDFAGWGRAEGPCITTIGSAAGGDLKYRLFADGYDSGKYIYSDSADLTTWSRFQEVPNGLSGKIRHGTVLRIS